AGWRGGEIPWPRRKRGKRRSAKTRRSRCTSRWGNGRRPRNWPKPLDVGKKRWSCTTGPATRIPPRDCSSRRRRQSLDRRPRRWSEPGKIDVVFGVWAVSPDCPRGCAKARLYLVAPAALPFMKSTILTHFAEDLPTDGFFAEAEDALERSGRVEDLVKLYQSRAAELSDPFETSHLLCRAAELVRNRSNNLAQAEQLFREALLIAPDALEPLKGLKLL